MHTRSNLRRRISRYAFRVKGYRPEKPKRPGENIAVEERTQNKGDEGERARCGQVRSRDKKARREENQRMRDKSEEMRPTLTCFPSGGG